MKNRFFAIFLAFALIVTGILPVASVYADGGTNDPAVVTTETGGEGGGDVVDPEPEPDPEPVVTVDKVTGVNASNNFPYMKVTWNALSDIDGYIVHYSLDSTFPADKTKTKEVAASKTSINIAELTNGKTYYVRLCGYKGDVVGAWSSTDSVTVKTTGLDGKIKSSIPSGTYYKNGKPFTGEVVLNTSGEISSLSKGNPYYFLNGKFKGARELMWKAAKNAKSNTKYMVITDCIKNRTCVYKKSNGTWTVYKYMKSCTGREGYATPKVNLLKGCGSQKGKKNKLSFSGYDKKGHRDPYTCWYATQFAGACYFHSILYWKDIRPIKVMHSGLGKSRSHGCIRLSLVNAIWFYSNIKKGTRIINYATYVPKAKN